MSPSTLEKLLGLAIYLCPPTTTVISPLIESFRDKLGLRPKNKKLIFLKTFFVEINGVTTLYAHDTKVEFGPAHMKESE